MAAGKFAIVEEIPDPLPADGGQAAEQTPPPALSLLLLALKALSQRAIAAIADLFFLFTVASAWWLWVSMPQPNVLQIISLALYALFVLAANFIVRRG